MLSTFLASPRALAWTTVLLWAFGAVGGKIMAFHSGAGLFLLSTFCTFLTFQIGARLITGSWVSVSAREILAPIGIISSFGYGWYWLFYGGSFRHTPVAALSAALNYTWPLFTAIFSALLFSQRTGSPVDRQPSEMSEEYGPPANTSTRLERAVLLIGMALGAVAVALVLFSVSPTSLGDLPWIAVALGLAAGAAYGFYSAFSSTISADQQFRFLVLSSISGMLVLLPFSLPELGSLHEVPPLSLAITILFGIVMDGVGYFVWTRAVAEARRQAIPIEKVTSIIYLLPVLSVIIIQAVFPAPDINLVLGLSGIALLSFSSALCQKPEIASRFFKRYRV